MRKSGIALFVALATLTSLRAHGTTWIESHVNDPISGARLKVAEPGSSGSYIYDWPGKADQVFWPFTDDNWLWFNRKSGYIAFGDDFANLDSAKRVMLRDWLKTHYKRESPLQTRLAA